jgi:hypothetical protein
MRDAFIDNFRKVVHRQPLDLFSLKKLAATGEQSFLSEITMAFKS